MELVPHLPTLPSAHLANARDSAPQTREGQLQEARRIWLRTLQADPSLAEIWANLVLVTAMLDTPQQALQLCKSALSYHPQNIELLRHRANLCFQIDDLTGSEKAFEALLDLCPNDMRAWINLGMTLKKCGKFARAESCYRQAIEIGDSRYLPQAHFNLANLLLMQGKWREGFAAYEARLEKPHSVTCPIAAPLWSPDLPEGSRILLWNDQGIGDAIMFMRFAAILAAKKQRLFLYGQKSLKAFAALAPFIEDAFYPLDDLPPMDAHLPLCSLPHALGIESIELWKQAYLQSPRPTPYPFPEKTSPATRRVGLVWGGNVAHAHDAARSIKLHSLLPLFSLPNIEWFSLQVGRDSELAGFSRKDVLHNVAPTLGDFADTASVLSHLDLLITVDTAAAHLAGAMGLPVWLLLSTTGTDWRWGTDGDTTGWYPSMRLMRQSRAGRWDDVVAQISQSLSCPD